mmetsp:Transcript_26074/g.66194  ORF Transcript_26074/g.66194 Transcript_26074/m.66194 type:complete len:90 (-) Transcript_26074:146-415(-)
MPNRLRGNAANALVALGRLVTEMKARTFAANRARVSWRLRELPESRLCQTALIVIASRSEAHNTGTANILRSKDIFTPRVACSNLFYFL